MLIEIKGLHKSFSGHKVLDGVDLSLEEGRTYVIIGRSGCGKSVLLKHIIGLLRPDKGTVYIKGVDIFSLNEKQLEEVRCGIGMVFQHSALFDSLTVFENVGFLLVEKWGVPKEEVSERVKESLEMVGLVGIEDKYPEELSGGMKKRVAIARALCSRPSILIYDEPTTGIDPIGADMINSLIKSLHDRLKVTSIVVTHDLASAFKIADKIVMLFKGRVVYQGGVEEVRKVDNPYVQQFIQGKKEGPISQLEV